MICVYYHDAAERLGPAFDASAARWLAAWPESVRARIERRRVAVDRRRSAVGWRLLELHLLATGHGDLAGAGADYPASGKPRCGAGLDFSLSHSGSVVVCAVSDEGRVGVDVERIRALSALSWRRFLSDAERVRVAADPRYLFDLWTRKESVVKARGGTALGDIPSVLLEGTQGRLYGERWYLLPLALHADHAGCLASEAPPRALTLRRVTACELEIGLSAKLGAPVHTPADACTDSPDWPLASESDRQP